MRLFSTQYNSVVFLLLQKLSDLRDAIHRAVMAPSTKLNRPSYRPMARAITPYHYMKLQPIPVRREK